jgi:tRNA modification GTPase
MFEFNSTIAAISTPTGTGGIGIVRISGKDAISIASKVYSGKDINDFKTHTVHYGKFINPSSKEAIDEGILIVMKAPNTYTREDIVEFQCHGSNVSTKLILEALLNAGAKLAERGEFTKRAFLNGRVDLTQAEAVIDIINSKTSLELKNAINQLEGHVSKRIKGLREKLIAMLAHLEAYMDFPEDDIDELTKKHMLTNVDEVLKELDYLLNSFETGKILREGISVAIVGKTNVGKSSFLNEMLNENKAIVTEIEGTTRDIIEDFINLDGVPVKIIDTAGIRETHDVIEKIGIERSKKAIEEAQIIIFILDISREISEDEILIFNMIKDKPAIVLLNKIDKEPIINEKDVFDYLPVAQIVKTSMVDGKGIENVKNSIIELFNEKAISVNNSDIINNIRHKDAIFRAKDSLISFKNATISGMPEDIIAIDLKKSVDELGAIIGEVVTEDVLDEVFSKFCIGK